MLHCDICSNDINAISGEPYLEFKNKIFCSSCYIDLIQEIYNMSGYGDGGLINYIFNWCIHSSKNRQRRKSLKSNKSLFYKLLKKYKFKCNNCSSTDKLTIDHIKPFSKGGTDNFSNLQILCKSCNSKKRDKIVVNESNEEIYR